METTSAATRRPCFIEEDDGLASLADMEAGFSGNNHHPIRNHHRNHPFFCSRSSGFSRRSSFRNISSSGFVNGSSPRSVRFEDQYHHHQQQQPHFLESCFLCKKPLGGNRDIFMYRGDTPFCSEECRQEQIEMDEAKEKNWNLSSAMKALRNKNDQRKSSSPAKSQDYSSHTSTVAAA